MIWDRLKNGKCPEDASLLLRSSPSKMYICSKCLFTISFAKFDDVVAKLYKPHTFEYERNNLTELNNLGTIPDHKEGFQDSSYF